MVEQNNCVKVRNVLLGILLLNILVATAKIIYGIITKTSSMIADGYHSFSDGTSNIVGLVGIWIASRPADENHPYGHHKFETLSTIVISLILFFISFKILINAYDRIKSPVAPEINSLSFIIMVVTLVINIFVTTYEAKKGKELKSSILISDAMHTRSDIYVSISVIISLIAVRFGLVFIDAIVAAVIAILIIKAGLEILIPGINVLSDAKMINSEKIYELVMKVPEVRYCHKIRTRGKENHIMIDLHVGINKDFTLEYSHRLAHNIEDMLKEQLEGVSEAIVHLEPVDTLDK
ncbi:cation diffusion facilitator family transporter [Brassicibacter mesophilus]|uniref:cation diffusion facilitator family transporter n=1 Tax=Brassicibacter mesophilus TaxID=745119 RepID=UPI003D24ACC0